MIDMKTHHPNVYRLTCPRCGGWMIVPGEALDKLTTHCAHCHKVSKT